MMYEQEIHVFDAQRVIIKFLVQESVKPADIFRRLTIQFKEENF